MKKIWKQFNELWKDVLFGIGAYIGIVSFMLSCRFFCAFCKAKYDIRGCAKYNECPRIGFLAKIYKSIKNVKHWFTFLAKGVIMPSIVKCYAYAKKFIGGITNYGNCLRKN